MIYVSGRWKYDAHQIHGMLKQVLASEFPKFVNSLAMAVMDTAFLVVDSVKKREAPADLTEFYINDFMKNWCYRFSHAYYACETFLDGDSQMLTLLSVGVRLQCTLSFKATVIFACARHTP